MQSNFTSPRDTLCTGGRAVDAQAMAAATPPVDARRPGTGQVSSIPVARQAAAGTRPVERRASELDVLLQRAGRGCQPSFERFYGLTRRFTSSVILRINGNAAETEELGQELYLKVWQRSAHFDAEKAGSLTWVTTLARNLALSSLRTRKARPRQQALPAQPDNDGYADIESSWPGPFEVLYQQEVAAATAAALAGLPSNQRQCLHLVLLDGMSHQELARQMDRPLGTVKSWVRRSTIAVQVPLRACL